MLVSSLIALLFLRPPGIQVSGPSPGRVSAYDIAEFRVSTGNGASGTLGVKGKRGAIGRSSGGREPAATPGWAAPQFGNPFDPGEVSVEGVFSLRDGTRVVLPAFWDGGAFRLRFCPTRAGEWRLTASVTTLAGRNEAPSRTFRVTSSSKDGFVRVSKANHRYLALDSGKSFVPIGLNLCWPDRSGTASYDARFAKLRSVGGNFARIWTTEERRLETKQAGLGRYDLSSAAYYDSVFELAARHGIRTMLTFDDYRVLAKTDYFNAHWDSSPYNSANGGPLRDPSEFFDNPLCRKLYKQRLRYLVARYSAYTSLAVWELYNEQDNIPKPGVPTEWFREMTDYLASIDPYHHIVTTSYSWDDKPEVWRSPALGLTQRHLYGQGDTVDFVSMIEENSRKLDRFGKPHLIGEFGITWKEPDRALDTSKKGTPLHDALWASIMTGDCGGALTWWWDNYLEPLDLWPVFIGISRFVAPIDFAHRSFRPIPLQVEGLTALGMQDAGTGETILWLHDPAPWRFGIRERGRLFGARRRRGLGGLFR
jgi:hypothetical protein